MQRSFESLDLMSAPLLEAALCLNSPDSVTPDSYEYLTASEPLRLDHSMLQFDPNMFANEPFSFCLGPHTSSISTTQESLADEDAAYQKSSAFGSPVTSVEEEIKSSEEADDAEMVGKRSGRKRTRRIASFTSIAESEISEDSVKPSKKSKSPGSAKPRSRLPTSAYRGVSRCTKDGRWQARIRIEKEVVYLGRFPTEEQAARRYDEAARLHHGATAMLNFITPEDIAVGRKSVFAAGADEQSTA